MAFLRANQPMQNPQRSRNFESPNLAQLHFADALAAHANGATLAIYGRESFGINRGLVAPEIFPDSAGPFTWRSLDFFDKVDWLVWMSRV